MYKDPLKAEKTNRHYDPYAALGNAVIERAASDYRNAWMNKRNAARGARTVTKEQLDTFNHEIEADERFFRSDWFKVLSDADGEYLIKHLQSAWYDIFKRSKDDYRVSMDGHVLRESFRRKSAAIRSAARLNGLTEEEFREYLDAKNRGEGEQFKERILECTEIIMDSTETETEDDTPTAVSE